MIRALRVRGVLSGVLALIPLAASALAAGTWGNPGTSSITASADSSYLLGPPLCGRPSACVDAQSANTFIPGFAGRDFGRIVYSECGASMATCPVIGRGFARVTGEGLGTNVFIARWKTVAQALHECECGNYEAHGAASLATSITVRIDTVPPGQPVTIYYSWWSFVLANYDPEVPALPDDPASVANVTLKLQGTDLIPPGTADFINVAAVAYLPPPTQPATGMILAQGGDVITIDIAADVLAEIRTPPNTPFLNQDQSWASYQGALVLSIDQPLPPLPTPGFANGLSAFSLDIGSDTEISDVNQDGDEVFDPGDVYRWYGPALPPNGIDGFRDDAEIFMVDYWPQAPNTPPPFTGAAVCSGALPGQIPGLVDDRFDLDGTDFLAISLRDYIPPDSPLNQPVPAFNTNCIYGAEYLVVSFDDDDGWHYAGAGCDIPVAALSPAGRTYGTAARADEVVGVNLAVVGPATPAAPAAIASILYGIHDEAALHPSLGPSPDLQEADDDDVDALDLALDPCEYWYFSPDHEAVGAFMFALLDPGAIYEVLGPPSYGHVKVIDPVVHLGLQPGTDIDAFEFVWLEYNNQGQRAFALVFSVDNDDPMTLGVDESGGLDPRMLYASYLTGVSFPLLVSPLPDDVDALTAIPRPLTAKPCTAGPTVAWADNFDQYLLGPVAGQGGWEHFLQAPIPDVLVTNQAARSFPQALMPLGDGHVVRPLAGVAGGTWTLRTHVYVELPAVGVAGLHLFNYYDPAAGVTPADYSATVIFDMQANAVIDALGGNTLPLVRGVWAEVRAEIDLLNDDYKLFYDGVPLATGSWTHGVGQLALAAVSVQGNLVVGVFFDDFGLAGVIDCNGNGVADVCDIVTGTSQDVNGNGVPDECEAPTPCPGDSNCDGVVNWRDIDFFVAAMNNNVAAWTALFAPGTPTCAFANNDVNGDGTVNWRDIDPLVAVMNTVCP